jgi:ketosteroid isomerase-like protein
MKHLLLGFVLTAVIPSALVAQDQTADVQKALHAYDQAVAKKDVETVRSLLAPELLLFEHSVRNDGAKDAFENHLKPEILEGDGLELSYSDLRVTADGNLALVTRQYRVKGTFDGKAIDSTGNETQVWQRKEGGWRLLHIHYSHACPKKSQNS